MQGSLARLQEGCGGVAAGIAAHLVHLVQQQQPVPYACALHRLPNSHTHRSSSAAPARTPQTSIGCALSGAMEKHTSCPQLVLTDCAQQSAATE